MSDATPAHAAPGTPAAGEPLYTEVVIDHYRHPRNRGRLARPDATAKAHSSVCGDDLLVTLRLAAGRVTEVRFDGQGCALSQALASIASERYPGMEIEQVLSLDETFTVDLLGVEVSRHRRGCATLHIVAMQRALMAGGSR